MTERKGTWIRPFELDPGALDPASLTPEALEAPEEARGAASAGDAERTLARANALPPERVSAWSRLALVGAGAALLALTIETVHGLRSRIAEDPLSGWPLAILLAMVAVSAGALLGREVVLLRRLQGRAELRFESARLATSALQGDAATLLATIGAGLPGEPRVGRTLAAFGRHQGDLLTDSERLRLFERTVLVPIDARAYRLILQSSRDVGLLTAISPYGLLDGLLVLWRTILMLRALAKLYGIAPAPATTAALLRRCLRNAALAGLTDVATHAVLEHAGASIAAFLSARAGQGAGNALLTAKLGIQAIKEVRPLAFIEAEPPSLRQIRKALLTKEGDLAPS